MTAELTIDIP